MKQFFQRFSAIGAIIALTIGMSLAWSGVRPARAETDSRPDNSNKVTEQRSSQELEDGQQAELDKQEQEVEEAEEQEASLREHVAGVGNNSDLGDILEVNEDAIKTYGDAVAVLNNFQSAIDKIKAAAALKDQLAPNLSDQERQLLDKLLKKDSAQFNGLNARITELSARNQELIALLSPISNQTVSEALGLRKLLLSELKDLRSQIEKLKELSDSSVELLKTETD